MNDGWNVLRVHWDLSSYILHRNLYHRAFPSLNDIILNYPNWHWNIWYISILYIYLNVHWEKEFFNEWIYSLVISVNNNISIVGWRDYFMQSFQKCICNPTLSCFSYVSGSIRDYCFKYLSTYRKSFSQFTHEIWDAF